MLNSVCIFFVVACVVPVFSSLTCGLIVLLSYKDSLTSTEKSLKKNLLIYFSVCAFGWFGVFVYNYFPEVFTLLNAFLYLSWILSQIIFYQFIYLLTRLNKHERFSPFHYLLPVLICGTLLIWSFFVPYEVQMALTKGKGAVYTGYEYYSALFLSKPYMRLLFNMVYISLILMRMYRYFCSVNLGITLIHRPTRWVWTLMVLSFSLILMSLIAVIIPRDAAFTSFWTAVTIFIIMLQHIIITYNIIQRNFLLYINDNPERSTVMAPTENTASGKRSYTRHIPVEQKARLSKEESPLEQKRFEAYFREQKPYLNRDFKITDLVDSLKVNRTYISGFVNETYGMNFNRYINRCRLQEVERLMKLPLNNTKDLTTILLAAGFSDFQQYTRTLKVDQLMKETKKKALRSKNNPNPPKE